MPQSMMRTKVHTDDGRVAPSIRRCMIFGAFLGRAPLWFIMGEAGVLCRLRLLYKAQTLCLATQQPPQTPGHSHYHILNSNELAFSAHSLECPVGRMFSGTVCKLTQGDPGRGSLVKRGVLSGSPYYCEHSPGVVCR